VHSFEYVIERKLVLVYVNRLRAEDAEHDTHSETPSLDSFDDRSGLRSRVAEVYFKHEHHSCYM
jgi:hypothetical protein